MLAITAWMQFVQIAFLFFIVGFFVTIAWMVISETRLRIYRHRRKRQTTIPGRFAVRDLPAAVVRARALERGWKLIDGSNVAGTCTISKDDAVVWVAPGSFSGKSATTDLAYLGASVARDVSERVEATVSSLLGPDPAVADGVSSK